MKRCSFHLPLTTPAPRGCKSQEFCGSVYPSVTAAEVSAALLFVIPPAPACRGSAADLSRRAVEGPAVRLSHTQLLLKIASDKSWQMLIALLLLITAAHATAQQIGQNTSSTPSGTYTLTAKAQLVVETVVVKDKQGKFIPGLSAKDFTVTEDGAPQTIRFCEHQDLAPEEAPVAPAAPGTEHIKLYKQLTRTQIAPEASENSRYKNRRLLALYFDMTAMRPADQLRALSAAEKFLRTQMTTVDLVAILRYQGGSVDILQDFTADRNKLLSILETMIVGEGQGSAETIDDASSADTGAAFGQDDSEFNVFNTDRQLSALQTAAKMLSQLNEKKSLIYFASGLRLNGIDNQAQLHATVDAAIRAGVSFWPVDARGLVAEAPLGDATQGSPGNSGMYSGTAAIANTTNFQQSQDTLYALAGDTGGKALFDNNDLTRGIVQAQESISDYYVIGYYTSNTARNGHFRRVKITLNQNETAKLDYRQGYYADKEFSHFTTVDKERQLEDALMLEDPITELSIAMEIDHFQLNRAEYFVPIIIKIPGPRARAGQARRRRAHADRLRRRNQRPGRRHHRHAMSATTSISSSPTQPPPSWPGGPSSTTPASLSCPAST